MANPFRGIYTIEDFELKDKRVFLRLDLNVPMKNGVISDETRIREALPTLRYALEKGAKLVVASHLGRPEKPEDRPKFSLEPVGRRLQELLDCEVLLVEEMDSDAPRGLLKTMTSKQIILLENLRFSSEETENGEKLARTIAGYTDVYINDAFGSSHRAHCSVVGVPALMTKKGIGFLMKKEIEMLSKVVTEPERPYVAVLGGAKVSDKIEVIERLIDLVDALIVGGAMAYTFLLARGERVGRSRVEKDRLRFAEQFLERVKSRGKKLLLPVDHLEVEDLSRPSAAKVVSEISETAMGVDIGPKTVAHFARELSQARTIFWNGPMGIFETEAFSKGTFAVAEAIAKSSAVSIVGGGDSAAAAEASGFSKEFSHISTGGGASLEFIQGIPLPGIEAVRFNKPPGREAVLQ